MNIIVFGIGKKVYHRKIKFFIHIFSFPFIRANACSPLQHRSEEVAATKAIEIKNYVSKNEDNFL